MKITIDTQKKTIEIVEDIYIEDLIDLLDNAIGKDAFEEYKIIATKENISFVPCCPCPVNPLPINPIPINPYPFYPIQPIDPWCPPLSNPPWKTTCSL